MGASANPYGKVAKKMHGLIMKYYSYLFLREKEFEKASIALEEGSDRIRNNQEYLEHALQSLFIMRDGHIRVITEHGGENSAYTVKKERNYNPVLLNNSLEELNREGGLLTGKIDDVTYLGVESQTSGCKFDFERLYPQLDPRKFQKWIIDLRANEGRDNSLIERLVPGLADSGAPFISSYLRFRTDEEDPKKFSEFEPIYVTPEQRNLRRSVIVLIGRNTCSSAEGLTLDLAAIPGTVLVGDVTNGSSGRPARYLADGPSAGKKIGRTEPPNKYGAKFALEIPSWLKYRLDQFLVQDRGIMPHIFIPTLETFVDGKDRVLETAIELHRQGF